RVARDVAPRCEHDVRAIDRLVLRRWLATLDAEGKKPSSRARALSAARAWFKWLMRAHAVEVNAAEEIPMPKLVRGLPRFLNADDAKTLVEAPAHAPERRGPQVQQIERGL